VTITHAKAAPPPSSIFLAGSTALALLLSLDNHLSPLISSRQVSASQPATLLSQVSPQDRSIHAPAWLCKCIGDKKKKKKKEREEDKFRDKGKPIAGQLYKRHS
jgi:hypothetical protein